MINSVQFSSRSMELLQLRNLSQDEISGFADILQRAKQSNSSAKQFLQSLSADELALVQKSNSLADNIQVAGLTAEGAQNLLSQPDGSNRVDLNNDGIVEVGIARTIQFPPANAPQSVKDAWDKATEGLSEFDKATLTLTMHHMIYGIQIEGFPQKTPLSPEQQWSETGINGLFDDLYSNLEFRVGMEGWTEHNQMLSGFYQRFESELAKGLGTATAPARSTEAYQLPDDDNSTSNNTSQSSSSEVPASESKLDEVYQLLLDARMGIDRKKLEEIEEKMQAVEADKTLSPEEKKKKLLALQAEKEQLIEEARQRAVEEEKRKALLQQPGGIGSTWNAEAIKQKVALQYV